MIHIFFKKCSFFLFLGLMYVSCQQGVTKVNLKRGLWRGTLETERHVHIPFTFEVKEKDKVVYLEIINAGERLKVDELYFEGDSLRVIMPLFDSEFVIRQDGNNLQGRWIKHLADKDAVMNFQATQHFNSRFETTEDLTTIYNVSGRWKCFFASDSPSYAVGEFKQEVNNKVTGTFLTTTGDYRFLEGAVRKDSLYLSCFDGSHAYLFIAKINDAQNIQDGKFYSGLSSEDDWYGVKNQNIKLPNADSLTFLKEGFDKIDFTFRDLNGHNVSLSNDKYKNKVVVIQIMGSWCPNCMDETAYLAPYYDLKKQEGFEIIGLAYERSPEFDKAKKNIQRVIDRFNVHYDVLVAGTNQKGKVNESLPMLKNFLGYPTTIIIDKKGKVRKIHTGFSGPATGEHFTEYKKEFEKFIDQLINE